MSERDWFKGIPSSTTVLVLGEVFEQRPPVTVAIQFGQEAYETYQTRVYVESLLKTRHDATYVDWSPMFYALYAGIIATGARQVVELGSTLFATVDKLAKLQQLSGGPSTGELEFIGIEPSTFFCRLAEALHPTTRILHVADMGRLPEQNGRSVSRCYQATSYALSTTDELVRHCTQSVFGSHGIWFSHDGETRTVSAMGKPLTLFSLPEFVGRLTSLGYTVEFIQKARSVYAREYEFFETWLVYHKLTRDEASTFHHWMSRLQSVAPDGAHLYPDFESAPLSERADSGFSGLAEGVRVLDFTSPRALQKLEAWKRSLQDTGGSGAS